MSSSDMERNMTEKRTYLLGVDSGGTKYLVRACDLDGHMLGTYEGPSRSHYGLSLDVCQKMLEEGLQACLDTFGGAREDCAQIVVGAAGLDSDEDQQILDGMYNAIPGFSCPILIVNDAVLAHHTVLHGQSGILLIAGTGAIVFGVDKAGNEARVGGWIYTMSSDEGSGRYIDAWALHHLSRYVDGCREKTPYIEALLEKTGVRTRKELMTLGEQMATPPWKSPGLGEITMRAAQSGDPYALAILRYSAEWNKKLIVDAVNKLQMKDDLPLRIALWGSTILKDPIQRDMLSDMLHAEYPNVQICLPEYDAAQGALEWAMSLIK